MIGLGTCGIAVRTLNNHYGVRVKYAVAVDDGVRRTDRVYYVGVAAALTRWSSRAV